MDPIKLLKQRAQDKRDAAIRAAKAEFRITCRQLDQLADNLADRRPLAPTPRRRVRAQTITQLILELMPKDQAFTVRDVHGLLEHANPGRPFGEPTISTTFHRLAKQGLMQKVRKGGRGQVLWASVECPVTDYGPFATMSIRDIISKVLKERGPLRPMEAMVAIQERGYRPEADRRVLLQIVTQAFRRNRDRFVLGTDGRWSSA